MNQKLYPESGVELSPMIARHYDNIMNLVTLGKYKSFIKGAIDGMEISADDKILDLGCGSGRNAALMISRLGENGRITGMDISKAMEQQFNARFGDDKRVRFINMRIDQKFDLDELYDIVFISFVIHGFPHEVRGEVIQNAINHLKPGGSFYILDYGEFDPGTMPPFHRYIFRKVECEYAFDFISRDWKKILGEYGFKVFTEKSFMNNYVRLLKARNDIGDIDPETAG